MAMSLEEVKIRLGMDATALRAGMNSSSQFVEKSLKAVSSKAIGLLKANVFLALAQLVQDAIPSAEEFWSKVYGTDPDSMAKQQQALDNIRKVTESVKKAQADLKAGVASSVLENATPARRAEMLENSLFDKKAQVAAAKAKADSLKADLDFTKGTKAVEARNAIVLEYAAALKSVTELQLEQLALEKAFKSARDAMWAADPPKLRGPNYPAPLLMNSMLGIAQLPFMGGLKGAIDKTNIGLALYEAMHRKPVNVIIKGVDE